MFKDIDIEINGEPRRVPGNLNILQLLKTLNIDPKGSGIAVAVGEGVITRAQWEKTPVSEGKKVEIIQAVQGG